MPRTKEQTLAWLRSISGELSTATLKRLDETLPWYGDMPPGRRSAVGLVAQSGIASLISWYEDPKSTPWIAADVFGTAPRIERIKLQAGENPCSGALQLALAARALREEPSLGAVLVNSLGAGGNQVAVVFTAP